MGFDRPAINRNLLDAKVLKDGFVAVRFFIQGDADLVDDLVAPFSLIVDWISPASLRCT